MGLLDAFWHLANFLAPAFGVAAIAAGFSKLIWRRALAGVGWRRLAAWAAGANTLVLIVGLALQGRDGVMSTYAAMVVASAVALWWAGFGGRRA